MGGLQMTKLTGLSPKTVRDMEQFNRKFGDIDRDFLWLLLEKNNFKDTKKFPNMLAIIQFIFDATVMKFKIKYEENRSYIDQLEQTVIDKRAIIERQEREMVSLRKHIKELENGREVITNEGTQL